MGKGRGISLYNLLANHVAVNAKNIGLNEYEGHSLYDMIYNNKTDIDIHMMTSDNHSLNKLNFVALDSIDVVTISGVLQRSTPTFIRLLMALKSSSTCHRAR
ncbi:MULTISPECIES: Tn3 family transposase [unclassified Endozoicomonas]|uniref:Tn3 family transposase n=1 Tax=unclassified Endozoicomonas TaxID=2644528 RepID=UPI003BB5E65A